MVIDTSAIIAILESESDALVFADAIMKSRRRLISTGNVVELAIVGLARRGPAGLDHIDRLLARLEVVPMSFDQEQAAIARAAYIRYGRGRHPARLNMGDCFAYALAKVTDLPLLFKGSDFSLTDIVKAELG